MGSIHQFPITQHNHPKLAEMIEYGFHALTIHNHNVEKAIVLFEAKYPGHLHVLEYCVEQVML